MILFFTLDTDFIVSKKNRYKKWLKQLALSHGKHLQEVNVIFCSDPSIQEINRRFLGHDYATDVLSFDQSSLFSTGKISGDLYIGVESVAENAKEYQVSFEEELLRVMAHGILHLLGYNDAIKKEQALMQRHEDAAILNFKNF